MNVIRDLAAGLLAADMDAMLITSDVSLRYSLNNGTVIRLGLDNYNKDNNVVESKETEPEQVIAPAVEGDTETEDDTVEEEVVEETVDPNKAVWDAAYNEALAGVDLTAMSNKQRKAAKANARAAADEAVAKLSEVVEEVTPEVEETVEAEEVVVTADAEDLTSVIE